ncbi:SUMF1/EgtB/PvdO family nonheme iron enzyme [Cohaesibacter celericrescens]|uniref:SUMF1/EgtB/PvdO family nonheme iron enzyme n=1 Tax=Cohaesibacter celericrescens TaxID=2067669 RepID=UPI003566D116
MKRIAAIPSTISIALLVIAGCVAAVYLWSVFWEARQPDINMAYVPQMAEQAVMLPNGQALYVQKFEVSVSEWNLCHKEAGCSLLLRTSRGKNPDETPATGLSYIDVSQYVAWIRVRSGHAFRLPRVEEWMIIAADVVPEEPAPIFSDPALRWASEYLLETQSSRRLKVRGSFSISGQGVADLDGSVWEWTDDCYSSDENSPATDKCPAYYAVGEHKAVIPFLVRDPARGGCAVGAPPAHLGFRLVTDQPIN